MNTNNFSQKFIRLYSNLIINPQMRAWQIYKYGEINQLTLSKSYQTPTISSPDDVLVKVKATSVNPIDIHLTSGYGASSFNIARQFNGINEFPITLGRDFSGTIVKVGRSVKSFQPNMNVIGALWPFQNGCHADYVICSQAQLALKPSKLSHIEAASIPYAGLTAYSALVEFGGLKACNTDEKRILILGSGGGVGTIAVQIAKSLGGHVTVTCREHSEEILKKLGADSILHTSKDVSGEGKFDLILDCLGENMDNYTNWLKPCSRFVTIKHPLLQMTDKYSPFVGVPLASICFMKSFLENTVNSKGGVYQWGFFRSSGKNLGILSGMAERGELEPVIQGKYDFDRVPDAFAALSAGPTKGKIVINVADDGGD